MKNKKIYILGGGHAGISAAISIYRAKTDLKVEEDLFEVHLVDKNPYSTVKPRLYEYELEETIVPFSDILSDLNVKFHQDEVIKIEEAHQKIVGKNESYDYDVLILALGSEVTGKSDVHNVNSYSAAKKLQKDLHQKLEEGKPLKVGILGGGFTGIEVATELPVNIDKFGKEKNLKLPAVEISLFDRGEVGAALGADPKPFIQEALAKAQVRCVSNANIVSVSAHKLGYEDKEGNVHEENFDMLINTLGQKPSPALKDLEVERRDDNRIIVDSHLNVIGKKNIFAVGDVAAAKTDENHTALMTCQQGRPQGRHAGYNAVAYLTQKELVDYKQPNYLTCMDLGEYGALYTEGWERKVKIKGEEAKEIKKHINVERIYPPVDASPEELYKKGKLVFKAPLETYRETRKKA